MSTARKFDPPGLWAHRRGISPMLSPLDATAHSLPPAAVLPEQFCIGSAAVVSDGVQALMQAVLDDALECWRKQFIAKNQRAQRLAREAEEWFLSEDASWPFSFVNVCAGLGVEPASVRQRLRHWSQSPPTVPRRAKGHAVPTQRPLKLAA